MVTTFYLTSLEGTIQSAFPHVEFKADTPGLTLQTFMISGTPVQYLFCTVDRQVEPSLMKALHK